MDRKVIRHKHLNIATSPSVLEIFQSQMDELEQARAKAIAAGAPSEDVIALTRQWLNVYEQWAVLRLGK